MTIELYVKVSKDGNFAPLVSWGDYNLYAPVADDEWHHVLYEFIHDDLPNADPNARIITTIYLDGKKNGESNGFPLDGIGYKRWGDLFVGGGSEFTIGFLRIALSSLAESHTTIEELYSWQFDGPHLRDFTGKKSTPNRSAGALDY